MSTESATDPDSPIPPPAEGGQAPVHHHHGAKHRDKLRSAWISFVGRIVAQISGAAATIVVGLVIVGQYASDTKERNVLANAGPVALLVQTGADRERSDEIDLAVLPLENLSARGDDEYFADAITEAVIAKLAEVEGLHVISRTSSMQYKDRRAPISAVATELGVEFVVEGTVVQDAGRVRVIAQLVDAVADRQLWAESYERPRGDILALQAELSRAIAQGVNVTMAPAVAQRLAGQAHLDPALYDQYIRGQQAAGHRTVPGFQQAIAHFEQAIRMDPSFAPAHAGLATTYALLGLSLHATWAPDGALVLARASAARALDLDPASAEALAVLAAVAHRLDWDWTSAESTYRRAIALRPGDALAHQWFAVFLAEQGRHREALAEAEFAREIDPLHADAQATAGLVHYYARRFDRAAEAERRALELDSASVPARLILAWSVMERGGAADAIAICEARSWNAGLDQMLATLADAHSRLVDRAAADEVARELHSLESASPPALLRLHLSRGEIGRAFEVLDRAIDERDTFVAALKVDPLFDRMRRDARYEAALVRLGLR